jgi:hypothetical protein
MAMIAEVTAQKSGRSFVPSGLRLLTTRTTDLKNLALPPSASKKYLVPALAIPRLLLAGSHNIALVHLLREDQMVLRPGSTHPTTPAIAFPRRERGLLYLACVTLSNKGASDSLSQVGKVSIPTFACCC